MNGSAQSGVCGRWCHRGGKCMKPANHRGGCLPAGRMSEFFYEEHLRHAARAMSREQIYHARLFHRVAVRVLGEEPQTRGM